MQLELLDENGEDDEVQGGIDHAEHKHHGPVGLLDTQHQVGYHDVDDATRGGSRDVEDLQKHEADAGQDGVDHEQDGSREHEQEVDGLGDAGEDRGDHERDDDGAGLVLVLLIGGHDERGADARYGHRLLKV